ncbi:IS1 family transposase [Oleiharenicola lentus]|uniref:IS1 family transposase n=1 Tax=Oleiharenicola lentus TaxID=2508720 RepID=UPI003F67F7AC
MLCEGNSMRGIHRMTGVHRDTIMRLGVRVGEACQQMMHEEMRQLRCRFLEVDEMWGFIGKKQKNVTEQETDFRGDVWTYIALDAETKLVPCFAAGKRDWATTTSFMSDLASRVIDRVQLSTDGMNQYLAVIEEEFGDGVDYGQIVKVMSGPQYTPERKYSQPYVMAVDKRSVLGSPDMEQVCTSHVEKANHTLRMHNRRLARLTNAFSKKIEHFRASLGLAFAYYNFVRVHGALRVTPAMAAGVTTRIWEVSDLVGLSE